MSERIISVAQTYFPFITEDNFKKVFRMSPNKVTILCNSSSIQEIRNTLMVLYHCRHYMPADAASVLFGISESQYNKIIHDTMSSICNKYQYLISPTDSRFNEFSKFFPNTHLIVDATELEIYSSISSTISGKKKMFAIKYQILVELNSGKICNIYGPCWLST